MRLPANPGVPVRLRRLSIVLVALFPAMLPALTQGQRPERFRSGRHILRIDVSVHDAAGHPVLDLQPGDFVVRIDGQPRTVVTAQVFGHPAESEGSTATAVAHAFSTVNRPAGRAVVVAVDRDSIRPGGERAALDTASRFVESLSPADAAAAAALPGPITDLTRDHAAVVKAILAMSGTQPITDFRHFLTWSEAVAYERGDGLAIRAAIERECPPGSIHCPNELAEQAREMRVTGRAHARDIMVGIADIIDRLGTVSAPKDLLLISAGIPFDQELITRYRDVAEKAAKSHVALFVVQLDQSDFDASTRGANAQIFGGREHATGLANIAAITGGQFYGAVGPARGVFDRIAADVRTFYQLAVESLPLDADGKPHKVDVKVRPPRLSVLTRTSAIAARPARTGDDAIEEALRQPVDVAELPLEAAFYTLHSPDPENVRVIVALRTPDGAPPANWGLVVMDGNRVVTGRRIRVNDLEAVKWSATAGIELSPGSYRLRVVAVAPDGRMGVLDVPMRTGLRAADGVHTSDLMVGTVESGELKPRASVRQDESAVAMIELSSAEPLKDVRAALQLTRPGDTAPLARAPLRLRTKRDDASIVVAEGGVDLSKVPAGSYMASVVGSPGTELEFAL